MINLRHFRYATTRVGFGAAGSLGRLRGRQTTQPRFQSLLATSVSSASSSSPFESASQDNISGLATLAAKAAIARVKADAAAKSRRDNSQIDSAQKALTDTTPTKKTATIIGNTIIQPYVSWGSPPGTVITTNDHSVTVIGNTVIQKHYQSWAYTPTVDTTA